jgi:hypothetical protein
MAIPDRRWEETFKPKVGAPGHVPDAGAANDQDDGRPDLTQPYRAFGHPRAQPLRSLFVYFNKEERKKYGKSKIQIQYEHLDSDDPKSEGFAEDGRSFSFVVCGARGMLRFTVRGWLLEDGYDHITFHRMPWIRSADRAEFRRNDEPVITGVEIVEVEEGVQGVGQRVIDMAAETGMDGEGGER